MQHKPDFNNILKVLRREAPERPTLFELFLNTPLYERLSGIHAPAVYCSAQWNRFLIHAFASAGYDYATVHGSAYSFRVGGRNKKHSISLNEGALITDRASFDAYEWADPNAFDYSGVRDVKQDLPGNMKLMLMGPGGVLENVIRLTGYDTLCLMLYDDEQLVYDLFEQVGERLLQYYRRGLEYETVGLLMSNDDWGFNTQTMLSPEQLRRFVFPWHKKIVELAHARDIPAVLHSCGYFHEVMDDVIAMGYAGKHSYEDGIFSVEDSYQKWGDRIAILGGIDLNFVITAPEEEIYARCKAMLEIGKTGYALGTGNSVPEFVPQEHYFAMIAAATGMRYV